MLDQDLRTFITLIEGIVPRNGSKFRSLTSSDTGEVVKTGTGAIGRINIVNNVASIVYVKFYDKATAAASTDTPFLTIPVASGIGIGVTHSFVGTNGFTTGLSTRCVTGIADNDATSPATKPILEIETF